MAILFRDKKALGQSVSKFPLDGAPDSTADDISLEDLFAQYEKLFEEYGKAARSGRRPVDALLSGVLGARQTKIS
jgi:hypothetical protein